MGERLDEIIRVRKRPSNFVMMDKTFLEDNRLSFKAKGILAYLLSKPDNWKVITKNLVNASGDGEYSVYAGLKELKKYGYFEKIPVRNEQGTRIVRWESVVYEVPKSLLLENCEVEKDEEKSLHLENQEIENQKVEETAQNGDSSLFPDFCEVEKNEEKSLFLENQDLENIEGKSLLLENQDLENQQIENLYLENRDRNNNYNNNNKLNNIYSQSVSLSMPSSSQGRIEDIILQIKRNIGYDDLKAAHTDDVKLIDEFVNIILDTMLTQEKNIRINGENKSGELVKHMLMQLTGSDIEHVLWQFKEHGEQIKKKPQYILSMLYHSPMELNAHYANWVQSDQKKGKWQEDN